MGGKDAKELTKDELEKLVLRLHQVEVRRYAKGRCARGGVNRTREAAANRT